MVLNSKERTTPKALTVGEGVRTAIFYTLDSVCDIPYQTTSQSKRYTPIHSWNLLFLDGAKVRSFLETTKRF